MNKALQKKYEALQAQIRALSPVGVAYSGGVDSALLVKVCAELPDVQAMAIMALTPMNPTWEQAAARDFALPLETVQYVEIEVDMLESPRIAGNPRNRCYYCKRSVFGHVPKVARAYGMRTLLDGTNADDTGAYRPGLQAAEEFGVVSPLRDQGFTKADVRELARELELPMADRPSSACLATRIPYNQPITFPLLKQIEESESYLRELGFGNVRVRLHEHVMRIEIPAAEFKAFMKLDIQALVEHMKSLGGQYITLDLQGLRSGSMDEVQEGGA